MGLGHPYRFFPENTAVFEIDASNRKPEGPFGVDVVVGSRGLFGNGKRIPLRNGAGKENSFSPNYRAGMPLVGQRNFPTDILGLVPVEWGIGMWSFPDREGASPLWPEVKRFQLIS